MNDGFINYPMRNALTSILLILTSVSINAQGYHGFPTVDGYWKVQFGNVTCLDVHFLNDICSEYQYIVDGDTIIGPESYKKINLSGRDRNSDETWTFWDSGYHGCYRNDLANKQVFFIAKDSLNEILLYDFNLEVNDTLPDTYVYHPEEYSIITIDGVDSILVNNTYLKRYHLNGAGFGGEYLIEGIGSTLGLLTYITPFFEQHYDLLCFKNDDEGLYYYEFDSTACELITYVSEPILPPGKTEIFPNPATDGFWVENYQDDEIIVDIYNAAGQRLKSIRTTTKVTYIDIAEIPKGMLLINISSESDYSTRVKLIKQDR
jgi:hypothetical protein